MTSTCERVFARLVLMHGLQEHELGSNSSGTGEEYLDCWTGAGSLTRLSTRKMLGQVLENALG